jgi:hypothetical protein
VFLTPWKRNLGDRLVNQHLYFTPSDEEIKRNPSINEIKEGDWMINTNGDTLYQYDTKNKGDESWRVDWRKIIASTDPKLVFNNTFVRERQGVKMESTHHKQMPQPSQAFIKAYCKQGSIDEVDVEMVWEQSQVDEQIYSLKLNPDNTVITHLIEEKMIPLSKVKELIEKHSDFIDSQIDYDGIASACCSIGMPEWDDEKWIKENL